MLIDFPRQNWLRERVTVLRLCVHCLSCLELRQSGIKILKFVLWHAQEVTSFVPSANWRKRNI